MANCNQLISLPFKGLMSTYLSYPCTYVSRIVGDFETNASRYEPHELFYTLRAYGQLNYVPPNSCAFFGAIERTLMSKFSKFDAASILEMLVSFVYIERFPVNFLRHIFSPHFNVQLKGWYLLISLCSFSSSVWNI